MGSPAAVPHLRRLGASPVVMRVFAVFLGLHGAAHLAGAGDSFTRAADGESVDYLAGAWTLWSSVAGVVIDAALPAVAVRAGGLSRIGARR